MSVALVGTAIVEAELAIPLTGESAGRASPSGCPVAEAHSLTLAARGIEETVSVQRLGIAGKLKRALDSTNPAEPMIKCVRRTSRNVKHWQNGDMALRWTAAELLGAERQFRRVIGHADLAKLAVAVERDLKRARNADTPAPHLDAGRGARYAHQRLELTGGHAEVPRRPGHPLHR